MLLLWKRFQFFYCTINLFVTATAESGQVKPAEPAKNDEAAEAEARMLAMQKEMAELQAKMAALLKK